MLSVRDDLVVSLDYTLRLADGQVVDTSEGTDPLQFIQGRGEIIPGLEAQLYGMTVGQEKQVEVAPADGYGEMDVDLFETLPRAMFPQDMELEQGMAFRMRSEDGQTVIAYVDSVEDENVVVNLNHPLAGERLFFSVKIADLREATPEELEGGCAGGCGGCCGCEGHDHEED